MTFYNFEIVQVIGYGPNLAQFEIGKNPRDLYTQAYNLVIFFYHRFPNQLSAAVVEFHQSEMAKRLIPTLNRVLVEKLVPPSQTAAGILLPEKSSKVKSYFFMFIEL